MRDPYFADLWRRYGTQAALAEAGWFDDGLAQPVEPDDRFLTTPVQKIVRNLRSAPPGRRAVLLTTGAFSPPHRGHLQMMELARKAVEAHGASVVGGYLSPSHDVYVSVKDGGAAALHAEHRIALCEAAVQGSDWLAVDPWEARYVPTALNFTDVIRHLETYLARLGPIEVHYVFGGDNAGFARAFLDRGHAVVVPRVGWEGRVAEVAADPAVAASSRVVIAPQAAPELASRTIRAERPVPPARDEVLYAVRDDLTWATAPWAPLVGSARLGAAAALFREHAVAAVKAAFAEVEPPDSPVEAQVVVADHQAQQELVDTLRRLRPVLSLDPATDGDANLAVSRRYPLSGGQGSHEGLVARPGSPPLDEQLAALPPGSYTLLDDDTVTGETMRRVRAMLPGGVRITGTATLLGESLGARTPHDVADLRDLLLGARHAGLVVELPDGSTARAPYVLPYVGPARLGTPVTSAMAFSRRLWEANAQFFAALPELTVADADPAAAALLSCAGFAPQDSLAHVCAWHLAALTATAG